MKNAQKKRKTIEWERLSFFKKLKDTKRTFHAKMGTIKNRNGKNLTEAKEMTRIYSRTAQKRS